jgi:uncharacterized protein
VWSFEWDPTKAATNERKHAVSFDEAQTVFDDDDALLIDDPDHSPTEERFVLLGLSSRLRVLAVVHCSDRDDRVIHIISARRAAPAERAQYHWQGRK